MGRKAILAETGLKLAKMSLSCVEFSDWTSFKKKESYGITNLVLGQVIRQVSHHDLGLGGDTILGRTALLLLDTATRLALLGGTGVVGLVGDLSQRLGLTRGIGGSLSLVLG